MGRIAKEPAEHHKATLSPFVSDFIERATKVPLHELPALLDGFPQHWPMPRGDLYHWIPLLNRFDHVLEVFNKEYGLEDGPQTQPFERRLLEKGDPEADMPYPSTGAHSQELDTAGYSAEGDRELVEALLHFTRILLEHCGNRSIYASSTHLSNLLHTTSLSLLRPCLKLGLRLAQRYQVARYKSGHPSAQPALLAKHYNFNMDNLHKIAMPFPKPSNSTIPFGQTPGKGKDKIAQSSSLNPCDLVAIAKSPLSDEARQDMSSVALSYYEQSTTASNPEVAPDEQTPATPTPARRTSNLGPSRDRPSAVERSVSTDDLSATPVKSREVDSTTPSTAPKAFNITAAEVSEAPAWSLLADALPNVPNEMRYELLNRVRIAKSFSRSDATNQELLEIRLLAIANLAFALNESKFQEKVGVPDAEEPRGFHLAQQLVDLLQPPSAGQVALTLQMETSVVMTLEALSKSRHKVPEVADALAITVNHGALYYELRKVVAALSQEELPDRKREAEEAEWRDAAFDLVNSLLGANVQARYAEKMVTAGIMAILVEVLGMRTSRAERCYEKVLQFFDSFIHGIPTAFQTLANVNGLNIIADLTGHEVDIALEKVGRGEGLPAEFKSSVNDYNIPFYNQCTLRQLFKNTVHMFEHNAGTYDRLLRNLIDTPQILGALKKVIENAPSFGSNVWSGALNIITSFIHNEPTCYQVIGEAGLASAFFETITNGKLPAELPALDSFKPLSEIRHFETNANGEPVYPSNDGILPVAEVMSDIPNAFGAFCLNEAGMQLFQASGALVKYFDVFLSPTHMQAIEDEDHAAMIGQQFDELSRHHPRLKDHIVAAVFNMLRRLKELCVILAVQKHSGAKLWEVKDEETTVSGGRNALRGPPTTDYNGALATVNTSALSQDADVLDDDQERAPTVSYLSVCFKFLEGFFHNNSMTALFCEESGIDLILDLALSPGSPHDLVAFPVFSKITQVIKLMGEAKPHLVLPSVVKRTQLAFTGLEQLMSCEEKFSSFSRYTNFSEPKIDSSTTEGIDGTTLVKHLAHAQVLAHLLGRTLAPPPYSMRHANQNNALFTSINLTDVYIQLIQSISKLHATCIWENLLLQRDLSDKTKTATEPRPFIARRIDKNGIVRVNPDRSLSAGKQADTEGELPKDASRSERLALKNTKTLRYLLSQVPAGMEAIFHSLAQAIVTKRIDSSAKQHSIHVAECLAKALLWELDFRRTDESDVATETRYVAHIIGCTSRMLLRNSHTMEAYHTNTKEALTLLLSKFYSAGGFTKLNQYLERFTNTVTSEDPDKVLPQTKDAIHAILSFYSNVVKHKCINEATQSQIIQMRDRNQPEFFQPGQFLVEIREAVLPAISHIWHSKDIDKFTDVNTKSIVDILRHILKAEGEDRALRRSEKATRKALVRTPEFKLINSNGLPGLRAMGYGIALSREALYRCNHSEVNAEAYCKLRQKDCHVPRFPIPEGEPGEYDESAPIADTADMDAHMSSSTTDEVDEDDPHRNAPTLTIDADGNPQIVNPSVHDLMSDDTNLGTLGAIPDDMREDLLAMADPRTRDILAALRPGPALQTKDTQELFKTVDDLNDQREALRSDLVDRCLDVLSAQPAITFELADLIQAAVSKAGEGANPRAEIGSTLVQSLMSLKQSEESPSKEMATKIQAYAHLVALILQDRDFFDSTLDDLKEYFSDLVDWVQLEPDQKAEDAPWIRTVLLIIERVLAEDEQPVQVEWNPPSPEEPLQPLPVAESAESVVSKEHRSKLFDALIGILHKVGKNPSLALSICRVLVVLTRRRDLATRLSEKYTLGRLFLMIRQLAGSVDEKLQGAFMLILRHMVEDDDVVRQIMRAEIKAVFENHRSSRAMDTTLYIRNLHHLALRSPPIFVQVTQELLEVANFDGNPHRAQALTLKRDIEPTAEKKSASEAEKIDADVDGEKSVESKIDAVDSTDGVVQFLLRELSNFKDVEDKPVQAPKDDQVERATMDDFSPDVEMPDAVAPVAASTTPAAAADAKVGGKPPFKPEEHVIYIYRCFVLQCLAELLACYNRTKIEFINFSRKSDSNPATPSKPRSGTLNYLLNTLLPPGTLEHRDDVAHRKRVATSNWATHVLVSLCTKTQENHLGHGQATDSSDFSDKEPELTFVRKFVLEHALRSFKDATTSAEPLDQRYSRLLVLGELFNKMLSGKVEIQRSGAVPTGHFSSHQHMGRLMYEKNFIGTLTSAIAELDLNFPNAKRTVKYILGPLKQLTDLGVLLSQTTDISSSSGPGTSADEDDISSATSVSEDDDDDREQTPDLFRGSSLAMFETGQEDDESEDDDDDEDEEGEMYEDGYDDEMDYEEEAAPDHGEVVSDDDEDDMHGMGEIEGVPGDVVMDGDIMMGDGDEEDSDDTSDDDDEDDDEDDDDDDPDGEIEFAEHMDEITGDDDNASLDEHDHEGDWEDEDVDDFEDRVEIHDEGSPHGGPLEHIAHVLGADDPSEAGDHEGIVRIDMDAAEDEFFEDEMAPEGDEGEDGEEYGADIVYEPEMEDDDDEDQDGGWAAWETQPPPAAILRGHHHHHHHPRAFEQMLGGMIGDPLRPGHFRTHRATPNSRDEDGVNPLLQRDGGAGAASRDRELEALGGQRFPGRRAYLPRADTAFLEHLVATVPQQGGAGAGIINVNLEGGLPGLSALPSMFRIEGRHAVGAPWFELDHNRPLREQMTMGRWGDMVLNGRPADRANAGNDEASAVEFRPSQTSLRWQEEARMLFGGKFQDKATRVLNMLFRVLLPQAMEAKRLREKADAERRAAQEKAAEEARKVAEAEKAERDAQEKKERDERAEREALERAEQAAQAAELAAQAGPETTAPSEMEGVLAAPEGGSSEAQAPEETPTERITISFRGRELDITSLGIDREYIEALPEEMREEVIMTQFATQRSQAAVSGETPSEISREFLDALPQEMQRELLRQEQNERRRERSETQRRAAAQGGSGSAAAAVAEPEEMNNADFMAMLDPALRQAVLMDTDEATLATLPAALQAEARALFGDRRPARPDHAARLARGMEAETARILDGQAAAPREEGENREVSRQRRPIVQMLDKAGIATLLRLMFVSLNSKPKTNLHGILSDVCKNTQNRSEVISILLSILQDGTADVNAVERSFAQLSLRAKQPSGLKTPQTLKRTITGQQSVTSSTELSPLNIVQQCLGTLNALANDNPRVPSFFLNEHETVVSQKTKTPKKGKGRESRAAKFPLNALLTLLDRKLITENTAVMETLASLLSHVTHPLTILLRRAKEAQDAEKAEATAEADKAAEATDRPETGTSDVPMEDNSTAEQPEHGDESAATEPATGKDNTVPEAKKKKNRDLTPPEVPEENIRLVVNILAARECPSKTFSDTLDIIKNLSAIPGAKEVFGRELIRQAQDLGQALLEDLEELSNQIKSAETGTELQGMALASFSSAGSKQSKLLRVLVALDHLFDPKRMPASASSSTSGEQKLKEDILATFYDSTKFDKLWNSLSVCLTAIRERGNMVNVATILLPLIESLMVVCRNSTLKQPQAPAADTVISSPPPESRIGGLFFNFTDEHRKILNELIRNNPKLMNGNLAVLAKNSKVLEFDNKRSYFSRKLHDRRSEARVAHPTLQLNLRRSEVFLDSFKSLYYKSASEIKYGKLNIRFHNEEGVDAGGVSREWFAAMARQMFNPNYALFTPVASDRTTFHPNTMSGINGEHLMFFKFVGRIIGKALYENRVLDCHFSRAVYRRILGKSVSLKDMETLDLDYYKSLVWILENDITDVTFESFSVDVDKFGVVETIDLIPNGRNIPVTEENKHEYVRHVVDYRLVTSVKDQLDNFLQGFHEIIPAELVAIFNEQELELLISGLPDIDVDDWKNNTEYTNYQPTSPQIMWFWRAVKSFDKEEKAKLLQFITGTSKVPLNGFKELEGMNGFSKFSIHRDYGNKERLPSSHTCFNRKLIPSTIPCDISLTKSQSSTFQSMRVTRLFDTSCTLPLQQEASISALHKRSSVSYLWEMRLSERNVV